MCRADVRLHPLIAEGMVLQRDREAPVWGTADPGETVVVDFRGQQFSGVADQHFGRWMVRVKSGAAGGPFPLSIRGKNVISLKDVRVGEVWLCSGQSNMTAPLAPRPGSKALEGTENPDIRLFTVPARLSDTPQLDLKEANWEACGPKSVGRFSAVAYYFGRDIQKRLHVPVGLIHASYGGSTAASWMNPAALAAPAFDDLRRRGVKPVLYNGMIAPLVPFGIRGVIWYQGEADTGNAAAYQATFPALIKGWRAEWASANSVAPDHRDFPFLFVQIAPYGPIVKEPQESCWAELREVQRLTETTVPNTAMVVSTDCGHEMNIHPQPKQPIGERLALAARAVVYGEQVTASGPKYDGMDIKDAAVLLRFRSVGAGLEARPMALENITTDTRTGKTGGALHVRKDAGPGDVPLTGFTIAGKDHVFVNAEAEIHGDTIKVWSAATPAPVAVRYGWADYPTGNLYNRDGLPASPFRTDDFPVHGVPRQRE